MPSVPYLVLKIPFSRYEFIDGGASAHIFAVSANVVAKVPREFENPSERQQADAIEAANDVAHEAEIHKLLAERRHPGFVQFFLHTPDGIFMDYMRDSVKLRLENQDVAPITKQMQHCWIRELISAIVWLEKLDYFHGDMRPSNILLDNAGHVKLCDFGHTTKRGERLPSATIPYYRHTPDRKAPIAGPTSEQFAMASCMYIFGTGHEPLHHLSYPAQTNALMLGNLPPTDDYDIFGGIISSGWQGDYQTLADLEDAINVTHRECSCMHSEVDDARAMDAAVYEARIAECRAFLQKEGKLVEFEKFKRSQVIISKVRSTMVD